MLCGAGSNAGACDQKRARARGSDPQQVGLTNEVRDIRADRPAVDVGRRAVLRHLASLHNNDPVGQRQRLLLVMGDIDEGDSDLSLQCLQLGLHPSPHFQVERAERLVQQQHGRPGYERARQGHPLLLASR